MASHVPTVSIGNYKGVMLCNRPFVGLAGTSKTVNASAKQAFVCGQVGGKLGTNVPISSKGSKAVQCDYDRPEKETALRRHRKWLADLQATKEQLEKQYLEDIQVKECRHKRFMERQAKMRAIIRSAKVVECSNSQQTNASDYLVNETNTQNEDAKHTAKIAEEEEELISNRPMWALTEQQAEKATHCIGVAEVDKLVEFANSLDFEKYINDTEVSSLIENVRARITELEAAHETATRLPEFKSVEKCDEFAKSEGGQSAAPEKDQSNPNTQDNLLSIARTVLKSDAGKTVGSIHSRKSLSAVAERSRTALEDNTSMACDAAVPKPLVMTHSDVTGRCLDGKPSMSSLPYMHRNPAV